MTYETTEMAENQGMTAKTSIETAMETAVGATAEGNGESLVTPSALSGKYRFVRFLGKGTQGRVYEAERLSDGERVAIKVLDIHSIQNWKEYELFWREAKTLQALRIKGVARFYEAMEDLNPEHPCAYLVQQQIHGKPLSDMIGDGVHFGITDVFSFAVQIVEILQQLHHHDPPIIHRDIKPSNLMLEPDGRSYRVYLTDFGAVCNPMLQRGGSTVAGTFGYMPPEQLMGKVGVASDIYALGVTLVELLSGISPANMEIVDLRLAIEKPLANVPYPVVSLLRSMTMPQVADRLCDHGAILEAFRAFARGDFAQEMHLVQKQPLPALHSALGNVDRLGQKDNLSLWLALAEQTPRDIPQCYKHLRPYKEWGPGGKILGGVLFALNPVNFVRRTGDYIVVFGLTVAVLVGIVGFVALLSKWWALWIILPILIIPLLLVRRQFRRMKWDAQSGMIHRLLKHGRKSLATVVDVRFGGQNPEAMNGGLFVVRYAFNPPDDALESDLIHEVSVCNQPLLSHGDTIPILYAIDKDRNGEELVQSIPFPLPVKSLAPLPYCGCSTRKGVIVEDACDNQNDDGVE